METNYLYKKQILDQEVLDSIGANHCQSRENLIAYQVNNSVKIVVFFDDGKTIYTLSTKELKEKLGIEQKYKLIDVDLEKKGFFQSKKYINFYFE